MKIEFNKFLGAQDIPELNMNVELEELDCAKAFGLSLRRLRKMNNLTLVELSEKVEIPNPTLNRYESGYNLPSIFMALKIANFFDVNIEQMIIAGICELEDMKKTANNEPKYIEQFVGLSKKLNEVFKNNTKVKFNDHKRKGGGYRH